MRVRPAEISDFDHLLEFIQQEAMEAEGRDVDRSILARGISAALDDSSIAAYWILADDEDVPRGTVSVVKEWSDWTASYYWWIQSAFIDPEYRGRGCLALLLDTVKKAARKQGCREMRLYVHDTNRAAIRAYEKAQFTRLAYTIMACRL